MIEHLSKKLQDLYPGRPKEGEVRTYRLAGRTKKRPIMVDGIITHEGKTSFNIPNTRGLPSSYVIAEEDGSRKSIVFVERELPTNDPLKAEQVLGEVVFKMEDAGEIKIMHGNYDLIRTTDMFLFYCPWVVNNKDKDFHLKNQLGYFLEMENAEEKATKYLEGKMLIHNAEEMVYNMKREELEVLCQQLKLTTLPTTMTERDMRARLIQMVAKGDGAKRLLVVATDKDVVLRKMIKVAEAEGVIKKASNQVEYLWAKGGEVLCRKLPQRTLVDSLILYFTTEEGHDAMRIIKESVTNKEPKEDDVIHDTLDPKKSTKKEAEPA